jgi:hypothetical protein
MTCHEDCRSGFVAIPEARYEVHSIHSGHILVDHQTFGADSSEVVQQFGSTWIDTDGKSFDLERKLERMANRRIIVDHGDHGPAH